MQRIVIDRSLVTLKEGDLIDRLAKDHGQQVAAAYVWLKRTRPEITWAEVEGMPMGAFKVIDSVGDDDEDFDMSGFESPTPGD